MTRRVEPIPAEAVGKWVEVSGRVTLGEAPSLDALGARHRALQDELAEVREQIADAIRAERAHGATYVELMNRSGYTSIETIRQIVNPGAREKVNRDRRTA